MPRSASPFFADVLDEADRFVQSGGRVLSPFSPPHVIKDTPSTPLPPRPAEIELHIESALNVSSMNPEDEAEAQEEQSAAIAAKDKVFKAKKKKKKKAWKRPEDRPKRPLSAYNLFFQIARERIINGDDSWEFTAEDIRMIGIGSPQGGSKTRRHRKTHGKIGFQDLAKMIASKWRALETENRVHFDCRAAVEKQRYTKEMEKWNKEKKNIESERKKDFEQVSEKRRTGFAQGSGGSPADGLLGVTAGRDQLTALMMGKGAHTSPNSLTMLRRQGLALPSSHSEQVIAANGQLTFENELRQARMENMQSMMSYGRTSAMNQSAGQNMNQSLQQSMLNQNAMLNQNTMTAQAARINAIHEASKQSMNNTMRPIMKPASFLPISNHSLNPGLFPFRNQSMDGILSSNIYQDTRMPSGGDYYEMANQVYNMAQTTLPMGYVPMNDPVTNAQSLNNAAINMQMQATARMQSNLGYTEADLLDQMLLPSPFKVNSQLMGMYDMLPGRELQGFIPVSQPAPEVLTIDPHEGLASPTFDSQPAHDDFDEGNVTNTGGSYLYAFE
jgi:hypothetical protein